MSRKVIEVVNGVARHPAYRLSAPINFVLAEGEQLAIYGPNGCGKTKLVNTIIGRYPLLMNEVRYDFGDFNHRMVFENIHYLAFRDSYGDADTGYYYQQRWHSQDVELSPTVSDMLQASKAHLDDTLIATLYADFGISSLLDKQLVMLSSGELRRLQIVKALMTNPRVLIMDNPFIGLDAQTRTQLTELLQRLIAERGLQLILVVSRREDIPNFVTRIETLPNPPGEGENSTCAVSQVLPHRANKAEENQLNVDLCRYEGSAVLCTTGARRDLGGSPEAPSPIISFRNVTLRYGQHTIFKGLNWEVQRGERWALHGRNGSGKSALLGLICGDNPQAYACDISLFGCRRGTGESIWDIKKRIGYVSPEMHRAYLKDLPAIEIVASGLHDSVGLYVRPRPEQLDTCLHWMRVFGIEELASRTFLKLSSGEQRMVLLARAFVKDPELLILDEPLHGLDTERREMVRTLIDAFCSRPDKTLIMVTHYPEELPTCITHHKQLTNNNG